MVDIARRSRRYGVSNEVLLLLHRFRLKVAARFRLLQLVGSRVMLPAKLP